MNRWQNQEEAYQYAMEHPSTMLAMDMGTGKTRVAIDVSMDRVDVQRVLVVCPKAVLDVWPKELQKHSDGRLYEMYTKPKKGKICDIAKEVKTFCTPKVTPTATRYVVINYDSVWRRELGDVILRAGFDMVILDESHRAKAAGSKVSRFLALLGRRTKYKLCLSGTPMANSPLDIYGQYRFLDPSIFGTNHSIFMQEYAVMGGPERRFVVGFKNQKKLNEKFRSIAYQCSMEDVSQQLKLPEKLPPTTRYVDLPGRDMRTLHSLAREFIAECSTGKMVVLNNVLTRALRMQQIAAGFCQVQEEPGGPVWYEDLNSSKEDGLIDYLKDIPPTESVVVFCVFKHDLDAVRHVATETGKHFYELSGRANSLEEWKSDKGSLLAVQIQAGAEGVDMTVARYAVYFSLPHSLFLYEQSKARLYRPGQSRPVSFMHLLASGTIDEVIYNSLVRKKDLIESIKDGTLDYGMLK